MVDFLTYQETYGGTLPETVFTAQKRGAEETILALLHPRLISDLGEKERLAVELAICAQIESGLDKPYAAEKTGNWQGEYAAGLVRVHGMPVSPGAISYLRSAGLMDAWV